MALELAGQQKRHKPLLHRLQGGMGVNIVETENV